MVVSSARTADFMTITIREIARFIIITEEITLFCSNCGAAAPPGNAFCANCGNRLGAGAVGATAPETIVWMLNAHRKLSLLKSMTCVIIFMEDKAVFAHLSSQLQKAETEKAYGEIKASGAGLLKRGIAMMQYWSDYSKKYYSMQVGQILAEDPNNFVIPYGSVRNVIFKCESTSTDSDGSTSGSVGRLRITLTDGSSIDFSHQIGNDRAVKDTLTRLFGARLKYRR